MKVCSACGKRKTNRKFPPIGARCRDCRNDGLRALHARTYITHAELLKRLRYDPQTGLFTWLVTKQRGLVGKIAGRISEYGYRKIKIGVRVYHASNLAWMYVHGRMPKDQIDHINGNKLDDRIANLRVVNQSTNQENTARSRINSRTGFLGVSVVKRRSKRHTQLYRSDITVKRKRIYLGCFHNAEEAHRAYLAAKLKLHRGVVPERFQKGEA